MEFTQDTVLDFLKEEGGKVKNSELIEHFKAVFPEEPQRRAAVRETFKNYVDRVAFVKTESGVKYVCLKKKFRGSSKENVTKTEPGDVLHGDTAACHYPAGSGDDVALPRAPLPGSNYGNDSQVRVPHNFTALPAKTEENSKSHEFVCVVEEVDSSSGEMGNWGSFKREKRESKKEEVPKQPEIPEIAVIEASPLPAEATVFNLPGPARAGSAGLSPTDRPPKAEALSGQVNLTRRQSSKGSQLRVSSGESDDEEDGGHSDSLSGSEDNSSPKGSRKHFIEVMISSSPEVRRSMVLRNSVHLSSRSDSDTASLVSTTLDDDRASVTLDPVEHEWMMCASDGEWGSLQRLLAAEPSLVLRKDFVTGFTCLHWAAKHGKPELIALIINFAKQHHVPISVDVRSNTGYTPLHIAAMHNHMEVVKLLVGAYNADVEIRDYSGRKACQYLTDNVSVDIQDIIGAYECSESKNADRRDGGRWRFSKAIQSNLKPLRLLNPNDRNDSVDGEGRPREPPLRRKSSLSRMKPKLQRLRLRTSQIVHSTTFWDKEEMEGSKKGSFKSRPKTHFFG